MSMKRRQIIKYTSLATGAAISAPLMSVLLTGCKTDEVVEAATGLNLFSSDESNALKAIIDVILPKTDSPSASEVGVHTMIDHMLGKVFPKEQAEAFKPKFDSLLKYLTDSDFFNSDGVGQLKMLSDISGSTDSALTTAKESLLDLKQQTIAYYLSSEEVAKKFLNYLPVPGEYEACVSLESVGNKKWAI